MTRSDQLRADLKWFDERNIPNAPWGPEATRIMVDAARFALRVWEGDQQLVEKVAVQFVRFLYQGAHPNMETEAIVGAAQEYARAVLAAITEEEKK